MYSSFSSADREPIAEQRMFATDTEIASDTIKGKADAAASYLQSDSDKVRSFAALSAQLLLTSTCVIQSLGQRATDYVTPSNRS